MRLAIALVVATALGWSGCVVGYRVTPSVTIDEHGRAGGTLLLGGTLGSPVSEKHAINGTLELAGGVVGVRPVTGVIASDFALEWLGDWQHIAVRAGAALGVGRLQANSGNAFCDLGARLAILPTVYREEQRDPIHSNCPHCNNVTVTSAHVGLALAADGQLGAAHTRFSVGPTFEYYILPHGGYY